MFDYINISDEKIEMLEEMEANTLANAGLMIGRGALKGILTKEEALEQMHNLFLAITVVS